MNDAEKKECGTPSFMKTLGIFLFFIVFPLLLTLYVGDLILTSFFEQLKSFHEQGNDCDGQLFVFAFIAFAILINKADDFFDEERMRKIRQWMMKILKK